MRLIELDLNELDSREKVHDALAAALGFPQWYGRNLDALHDLMEEGFNANFCLHLILPEDQASPLADWGKRLAQVLLETAETCQEEDNAFFFVYHDATGRQDSAGWER